MNVRPIRTDLFKKEDDLSAFIMNALPKITEESIIAVTSKIVALAEGRVKEARSAKEKERIIKAESEWAIKTKYVWLTIKDGVPMANAGIDESNAEGKLILLPKNSFRAASKLRSQLLKKYKLKNLGVVITDSRVFPLRGGVTGVALGYAGFRGVRDYRGKSDIFGRALAYTRTDVADSIATAAVLEMGEGNEQIPLALITNAPVEFVDRIDPRELLIDIKDDMYAPLFQKGVATKGARRKKR